LAARIVAAGYVQEKPMTFKTGQNAETVLDKLFEYLRDGIGRIK